MKTRSALLSVVACLLLAAPVMADVVVLEPVQTAVTEEEGTARVAVEFDLSGLRSGDGRCIDIATLTWSVSGAPEAEIAYLVSYPIDAAWHAQEVSAELEELDVGETAAASWEITPEEHENGLGDIVRLDLTGLASTWAGNGAGNHGVVIETGDIAAADLEAALSTLRLTVHYGFRAE
ncbi:MAG TPA: hypothetical protein VF720_03050 [Candidatus Eisenbacteria bacterium]